MDNKRLPIWSLINEIKNNNYYRQSRIKSRIPKTLQNETEMEGSIAIENVVTQHDTQEQQKTSGTGIQYTHKRKQSANIPYKMSIPRTNIEKIGNSHNYVNHLDVINLQPSNQSEIDEEDDEECNVGGDAEETIVHQTTDRHQIVSSSAKYSVGLNKIRTNKENYQRSSTTKSGSSSVGHVQYCFSPEEDEDNFLTLECDENLYEDERTIYELEDQEEEKFSKPLIKLKQSKVDAQIRNHQSKNRVLKESVNNKNSGLKATSNDEECIKEFENIDLTDENKDYLLESIKSKNDDTKHLYAISLWFFNKNMNEKNYFLILYYFPFCL